MTKDTAAPVSPETLTQEPPGYVLIMPISDAPQTMATALYHLCQKGPVRKVIGFGTEFGVKKYEEYMKVANNAIARCERLLESHEDGRFQNRFPRKGKEPLGERFRFVDIKWKGKDGEKPQEKLQDVVIEEEYIAYFKAILHEIITEQNELETHEATKNYAIVAYNAEGRTMMRDAMKSAMDALARCQDFMLYAHPKCTDPDSQLSDRELGLVDFFHQDDNNIRIINSTTKMDDGSDINLEKMKQRCAKVKIIYSDPPLFRNRPWVLRNSLKQEGNQWVIDKNKIQEYLNSNFLPKSSHESIVLNIWGECEKDQNDLPITDKLVIHFQIIFGSKIITIPITIDSMNNNLPKFSDLIYAAFYLNYNLFQGPCKLKYKKIRNLIQNYTNCDSYLKTINNLNDDTTIVINKLSCDLIEIILKDFSRKFVEKIINPDYDSAVFLINKLTNAEFNQRSRYFPWASEIIAEFFKEDEIKLGGIPDEIAQYPAYLASLGRLQVTFNRPDPKAQERVNP